MSKFVIVIDCQNDFMDKNGALSIKDAEPVITNINLYLNSLNPNEVDGVLFTYDTHTPEVYNNSEEGKMFPIHCVKDTWGWDLAVTKELVRSEIPVYTLHKGVFDMWSESDLTVSHKTVGRTASWSREHFFNTIMPEIDEVEIIGVASDFCVKDAIDGLLKRNFKVTVPNRNLVKGIAREIDQVIREEFPQVRLG